MPSQHRLIIEVSLANQLNGPSTNIDTGGACKNERNDRDCSRATGFIQLVHDEVRQGFVDGLRLELHATYPAQDAHGSALASAPGRHSFASCDSAGCPAPRHLMWMAAACHQETSRPFPRWAKRAS